MFRSSLLFWTGAAALAIVAMCIVSPRTQQTGNEGPTIGPAACKIRQVTRRRRTRKAPMRRLRSYARVHTIPHLMRHTPCIERS
ncbi:MAG: hypothetical protein AB1716_23010 [Planctomycetota bacterium]